MVDRVNAKATQRVKNIPRYHSFVQIIYLTCRRNVYYESKEITYFRRLSCFVQSVLARFSNLLNYILEGQTFVTYLWILTNKMVEGTKCVTNGSTRSKGENRRLNRTPKPHSTSFILILDCFKKRNCDEVECDSRMCHCLWICMFRYIYLLIYGVFTLMFVWLY